MISIVLISILALSAVSAAEDSALSDDGDLAAMDEVQRVDNAQTTDNTDFESNDVLAADMGNSGDSSDSSDLETISDSIGLENMSDNGDDAVVGDNANSKNVLKAEIEPNGPLGAPDGNFTDLNRLISNAQSDSTITLDRNYVYTQGNDNYPNGINIGKSLTIDGQDYIINANKLARIFRVTNNAVVTFKNINFLNGSAPNDGNGGAVWKNGAKNVTAINCTFINNLAFDGAALYGCSAVNCTFEYNNATQNGGTMFDGSAVNCTFAHNFAKYDGGAMCFGTAVDCNFTDNRANRRAGGMRGGSAVNCTFEDNYGFYDGGGMCYGSAVNCTFIHNYAMYGGALSNASAIDCSFVNNQAGYGGGLRAGSAVNCTFEDNNADYGGAVDCSSANNCSFVKNHAWNGGALYGSSAVNCTFGNNDANDGGAQYGGSAVNCTFEDNYAYFGGAMRDASAENCNFSNNRAGGYGGAQYGGSAVDCTFVNDSADYGRAICEGSAVNCTFVNDDAYKSNIQFYSSNNTVVYSGDDVLFYHLPECTITVNLTDKDGNSQTVECNDKGWHVERIRQGNYTVNFTISSNENQGEFVTQIEVRLKSIKDLDLLIRTTQNDTIILNEDYIAYDQDLADGIIINKSLTIDGQGHIIDANKLMRIFQVTNNAVVIFKNITFLNGWTADDGEGGAVWNNGAENVTVINSTFENNRAYYGGAMSGGSAVDCTFDGNSADYGGAMSDGSAVNCTFVNNSADIGGSMSGGSAVDCTFVNNSADYGGAMRRGSAVNCTFVNNTVQNDGGAMIGGSAVDCTFVNNSAGSEGGVITDGSAVNCSFVNNSATYGGAMYVGSATDCTFVNNSADYGGAMIGGSAVNCTFVNNTVQNDGGAIFQSTVVNCTFVNNTAGSEGGAMYGGSAVNCTFVNNSADYGGAITDGSAVNCTFVNNTADFDGGALYSVSARNCSFENNTASQNGGAMSGGSAVNCTFVNNSAVYDGGAMFNGTARNCTFENNTSDHAGGAMSVGSATDCTFVNNTAIYGGAMSDGSAVNCSFVNNSATYGGAMYGGSAVNCTFENNRATNGGAMEGSSAVNCSFENNRATNGGAMSGGSAENSTFSNNTAEGYGGAAYFLNEGANMTGCNFTNNYASRDGGAVYFVENGTLTGCYFADNSAFINGGAAYFNKSGEVKDSRFDHNVVNYDRSGGAIYFNWGSTVTNSNFTDNKAQFDGGAIYFNRDFYNLTATVTGCNFINNSAYYSGAGIYFDKINGTVTNCNFTDNKAQYAPAVYFYHYGEAANCNFVNNSAQFEGGAVIFWEKSTVTACNFTGNYAEQGGAIRFRTTGTVIACNFTGNSASDGGALYFVEDNEVIACNFDGNIALSKGGAIYSRMDSIVRNSNFTNNKANSTGLTSVNDNRLIFTFTGDENYINAIYAPNVNFENVSYWNGAMVNSKIFAPVNSDLEAGIDIVVEAYNSLNELVDNVTIVTNVNGKAVYDYFSLPGGDYTFKAYHPDDSYYTYIENTGSFTAPPNYNLVVLDNQTVYTDQNIIVKLNATIVNETNNTINPNNVRLFFILPNDTEIEAVYENGVWSADYAFDQIGDYIISARLEPDQFNYEGIDYVLGQVYSGTVSLKIIDYAIGLNVVPGLEGANTVIDVTVPDDVSGTVTVSINGTDYDAVKVSDGHYQANVALVPGDYIAHATVSNDLRYADKTSEDTEFEVVKLTPELNVEAVNITYGADETITVTLPADAGGSVTITVDNKDYTKAIDEGTAVFVVSGLGAGNYIVDVSYTGDDRYSAKTGYGIFAVSKANSTLAVSYEDETITVSLEGVEGEKLNETVYIIIDGNDPIEVLTENGVNETAVSPLAVGDHGAYVVFNGNGNYLSSSNFTSFSIPKANNATVEIIPIKDSFAYGEDVVINVTVKDGETGLSGVVNLTIGGVDYAVIVTGGLGQVTVKGLENGTFPVSAKFLGNENYTEADAEAKSVVVNPSTEAGITAGGSTVTYGEDSTISVFVTDGAGNPVAVAKVNVTIGSGEAQELDVAADGTVVLGKLNAKTYAVAVSYADDVYGLISTQTTVVVNPAEVMVIVSADNYTVNAAGELVILVGNEAQDILSGTATVEIDGQIYREDVPIENGGATLELSGLAVGEHTVKVTFHSPNYKEIDNITSFKVSKATPVIDVVADEYLKQGDAAGVNVTVMDGDKPVEGFVVITVNGEDHIAELNGGKAEFVIFDLLANRYDIAAKYLESDNYTAAEYDGYARIDFITYYADFDIIIANGTYGDKLAITVENVTDSHGDSLDGHIIIIVYNEDNVIVGSTDFDVVGGSGTDAIAAPCAGNLHATASFHTEYYGFESDLKRVSLIVDKAEPTVNITYADGKFTINLDGVNDEKLNETVYLIIDGNDPIEIVTENGVNETAVSPLAVGDHSAYVVFHGNDNYLSRSNFTSFSIPKSATAQVSLTVDPVSILETESATIIVSLVDGDAKLDGIVIVTVGGVDYGVNVTAGEGTVTVRNLAPANYTVSGRFIGSEDYKEALAEDVKLEVSKAPAADVKIIAEGDNVVITMTDEEGKGVDGVINVTVDGEIKEITIKNGTAIVPVGSGAHNVSVNYAGDNGNVVIVNNIVNILPKVNKANTKILISRTKLVTYNKTIDKKKDYAVYITLTDVNGKLLSGKTVRFGALGKVYSLKTDAKGKAKMYVSRSAKGKYDYSFSFLGDESYNACFVSKRMVITAQKVKLVAKKKTFKAKRKVKKYTVALKNRKGKAIKGKKLVLVIKKKKYTAKTNKKGKATFKIKKLNKKGTYKVKVKFAGDKTYKKITKKSKIKIK